MHRLTAIIIFGIAAILIFKVGALALDSVGEYQMTATYNCNVAYTETEHQRWCRNELDGFGSLYDGGQ